MVTEVTDSKNPECTNGGGNQEVKDEVKFTSDRSECVGSANKPNEEITKVDQEAKENIDNNDPEISQKLDKETVNGCDKDISKEAVESEKHEKVDDKDSEDVPNFEGENETGNNLLTEAKDNSVTSVYDEEEDDVALNGDDLSGEKLSRTNLYIRGLSPDFNDKKLYDLCKRFGQIVSTKAIMHKQSMICKGYGFVDFSTEDEARKAVIELQKEQIPAQMARQQEQDLTNIYISNLPKGFDEKKLEEIFQKYGTVVSTRILRDQSGNTKKVGFVRMESQEMCEKVISLVHNKPLEGYADCKLLCKFADAGKRRKPIYNNGGSYDQYDAFHHQHNHHNFSSYSNHQSAYTPYYANFPKGYNAASPSTVHPAVNGASPNAVPWSSATPAAPFGLNALASTAGLNYYNLLLANQAFGNVANNPVGSLLSGNPLAAATLGGTPYFQSQSGQLASSVANNTANHSNLSSFLVNSANSQYPEASNVLSSSQTSQNGISSLVQNSQTTGQGSNQSSGNAMVADMAAIYQQQQSNNQQMLSNLSLSHSMSQLPSFPQNNQPRLNHSQLSSSMNSGQTGARNSAANTSNMYYSAMLNGASSPLDGAQNSNGGGYPGNTPPNAADEMQQQQLSHLKTTTGVSNGGVPFNLTGNSSVNAANFPAHNQLHLSAGPNNNPNGLMGNGQNFWAVLQQQQQQQQQSNPAVAAYAAAFAPHHQHHLAGSSGNGGSEHLNSMVQNSANNSGGLHLMSRAAAAATTANGVSAASGQY